jgi:hypothetical protein
VPKHRSAAGLASSTPAIPFVLTQGENRMPRLDRRGVKRFFQKKKSFSCFSHQRTRIACAMKGRAFCGGCLSVFILFLAAPLLCAQNPDELLVVRFPATQGYINRYTMSPPFPPFPIERSRIATSSNATKRQTVALRPGGGARGDDRCPGRAVDDKRCEREVVPLPRQKKPLELLAR